MKLEEGQSRTQMTQICADQKEWMKNTAMVLTPKGVGAIAVVRLRGEGVDRFLEKYFSKHVPSNRCVYGDLRHGDVVIDDAVAVREEDFVDLNVHGGMWVVRCVLQLAQREGFEVIDGPAPQMLDGATMLEKEVLAHLPRAGTELAIRVLLDQPKAWQSVRKEDAARMLDDRSLWWLLNPPHVAIVGIPNVGKSTLANQLFAQQRSITADLPGTTRDWVGELANLDGLMVMLVDTPGVRGTMDSIEREAIARSGEEVGRADLVIVVLDPTQRAQEQLELMKQYPEALIVANKADWIWVWQPPAGAIKTVATDGEGIDDLRAAIRRRFGCDRVEMGKPRWWTQRQREILAGVVSGERSLNEI